MSVDYEENIDVTEIDIIDAEEESKQDGRVQLPRAFSEMKMFQRGEVKRQSNYNQEYLAKKLSFYGYPPNMIKALL